MRTRPPLTGLSKLEVRPPSERAHGREPLSLDDLDEDDVAWGEVTRITHFGAFVDVGCGQTDAFLHISDFPGRLVRGFFFVVVGRALSPRARARHQPALLRRLSLGFTLARPSTPPSSHPPLDFFVCVLF